MSQTYIQILIYHPGVALEQIVRGVEAIPPRPVFHSEHYSEETFEEVAAQLPPGGYIVMEGYGKLAPDGVYEKLRRREAFTPPKPAKRKRKTHADLGHLRRDGGV